MEPAGSGAAREQQAEHDVAELHGIHSLLLDELVLVHDEILLLDLLPYEVVRRPRGDRLGPTAIREAIRSPVVREPEPDELPFEERDAVDAARVQEIQELADGLRSVVVMVHRDHDIESLCQLRCHSPGAESDRGRTPRRRVHRLTMLGPSHRHVSSDTLQGRNQARMATRASLGVADLDLAFFFAGTQSREETSSAILATLLQHDDDFRARFMREIQCSPSLDPTDSWTVRVEDARTGFRRFDVTLETTSTIGIVENKLAQSAKRPAQLVEYYDAAVAQWPERRVIALYLTPETSWGADEVAGARTAIEDARRSSIAGADWAQSITWAWIHEIINAAPDPSWFAASGLTHIESAIQGFASRVVRSWTPTEFVEAAETRGPGASLVATGALKWLAERSLTPDFGQGATGPLYLTVPHAKGAGLRVVKVYVPEGSINISYKVLAGAAPFDQVPLRVELIRRLNAIPGTAPIRDEYATDSESSYISNEVLADPVALAAFFDVMDWVAELLAAAGQGPWDSR